MKTLFVLLATGAAAGAAIFISKKYGQQVQKDAQQKGALDPNYVPDNNGMVWAADQKKSMADNAMNPTPVNPIPGIGWNPAPDSIIVGGITVNNPKPTNPSSQTFPAYASQISGVKLSPTFWAADKVPVNPNLPFSDADPNLVTSWWNV